MTWNAFTVQPATKTSLVFTDFQCFDSSSTPGFRLLEEEHLQALRQPKRRVVNLQNESRPNEFVLGLWLSLIREQSFSDVRMQERDR